MLPRWFTCLHISSTEEVLLPSVSALRRFVGLPEAHDLVIAYFGVEILLGSRSGCLSADGVGGPRFELGVVFFHRLVVVCVLQIVVTAVAEVVVDPCFECGMAVSCRELVVYLGPLLRGR
jgi:hypothetical protein